MGIGIGIGLERKFSKRLINFIELEITKGWNLLESLFWQRLRQRMRPSSRLIFPEKIAAPGKR